MDKKWYKGKEQLVMKYVFQFCVMIIFDVMVYLIATAYFQSFEIGAVIGIFFAISFAAANLTAKIEQLLQQHSPESSFTTEEKESTLPKE